jgi:hypothetical protein
MSGVDPREHRPRSGTSNPPSDLEDLTLTQLRAYRAVLGAEEVKVSYWRRLTQTRIDAVVAQVDPGNPLPFDDLVRILGDTGNGRTRRSLIRVSAAEPLPDLPELSDVGTGGVDPRDPGAALDSLETAERKLSNYSQVLHSRLDRATRELIRRYRADPDAALALIPKG